MKVIATHINADFDGFAAMIALYKLHPDAKLCFPGAREPGLRQFLEEHPMELPEISIKQAIGQNISHLILVDAGREERLGNLASVLQRTPRPFVELYDHHPREQISIQADKRHIDPVGSTTTIAVRELMAAENIPVLTSLEASILLAGIYEDTASFVSAGTTPKDFEAALFLLQRGAEISIVNRLLTHRLQPEHVAFFNTMVSKCETVNVEGIRIVISAFNWHAFLPEAAYVVHRLMDLEPIDVFFGIINMEGRVHIIARSVSPDVDVGHMMSLLGGGGHKMAASTVMKGVTLVEVREKLIAVLQQNLRRREKASDLMKRNIIQVEATRSISEAAQLMNSYRINSLVVRDDGRVVGTISRQIVDGAVFHGLHDRPVADYMVTDLPLIDPATPIHQIVERMISGRTRFVLVGKDPSAVEGIITRMDLLRFQYEATQEMHLGKGKRTENLQPMLKKRLPDRIYKLLEEAGDVAEKLDCRMYLVGGMVRDLLLHRDNIDVDLVVEGDGIQFAKEFAKKSGTSVAAHKRFGTAVVLLSDGFKLDVATARTESYHAPAALPQVIGGILRQDLYRRDFTINTLAIDLSPKSFGTLIDYFGGWNDLHQGIIRVLHGLSFIDDPTRTLRAIRFATRFNFEISKDTQRLMESAVESRVLDKLSGKRFWTELRYLLQEDHPIPAIRMLHQFKLLPFIHPLISLDAFLLELLYQVQSVLNWFRLNFLREQPLQWLVYLMALLEKLDRGERLRIGHDFQLTSGAQQTLRTYKADAKDIRARLLGNMEKKQSTLYFSLKNYRLELLLYAMARSPEDEIRQQIAHYLGDLRAIKLSVSGDDLLQLGLPPGRQVREVLDEIMRARLDEDASSREQQLERAARIIGRMQSSRL